eukprot:CAMPEP_0202712594 /NCGR_PEP_ID=MMETSP1385-20130828/43529_1 /ASSEMBLY_ACC=CAM_ASM_000861 /TAXON_ID=933848 /ORGANISM="Elphidium margaritaceum" /LENGTH=428 /DNA_ID=CAMNT_0049372681 /DNA_START=84 /DNA_END=1370 /DNA_ORIENTATION=-
MFCCWALQEIMERGMGMAPNITRAASLHSQSRTESNPMKHYRMNKMLTKSLDIDGRFRIQTRGTIYFIKAIHQLVLFIVSICVFASSPEWFTDHFIHLRADTTFYAPYMHVSASLLGYYAWEVTANRYGRLAWSVLVHHWITAAISAAILLGRFSPFATWYGFTLVSMCFPVFIVLGFRAQFSNKYPNFTRRGFTFSFYYWIAILVLNLSGQVFIIFNSLLYHYNESIHIGFIAIMVVCIFAWLYDDLQLLKALRSFSTHEYEDADILNSENRSLSRNLGGRTLFAMSVLHDVEETGTSAHAHNKTTTTTLSPPKTHNYNVTITAYAPTSGAAEQGYDNEHEEAQLEKRESLSNDDVHEIHKELQMDNPGTLQPSASTSSPDVTDDDAPDVGLNSPTDEAATLAKFDNVNLQDLKDVAELQKDDDRIE